MRMFHRLFLYILFMLLSDKLETECLGEEVPATVESNQLDVNGIHAYELERQDSQQVPLEVSSEVVLNYLCGLLAGVRLIPLVLLVLEKVENHINQKDDFKS